MIRILPLFALLLASCSSFQEFVPRERATGESPTGKVAAEYLLEDGGNAIADLRVWCHGAWNETTEDGEDLLVVHIGMEVENRSDAPIQVDESALRVVGLRTRREALEPISEPRRDGPAAVEPGETAVVHFLFDMPDRDLWASDLRQFEVAWAFLDGAGRRFEQVTPFRTYRRPSSSSVYFVPGFSFRSGFIGGWYWHIR